MKTPTLTEKLIEFSRQDILNPPDECIIWTGNQIKSKTVTYTMKDAEGVKYKTVGMQKVINRIFHEGKWLYPVKHIQQLIDPTKSIDSYRARQICQTTGCVNPHPNHHRFTPIGYQPPPPPFPSLDQDDWTLEDAIELLKRYQMSYPNPPIDPDHDLLMDIPPNLLKEALPHVFPDL